MGSFPTSYPPPGPIASPNSQSKILGFLLAGFVVLALVLLWTCDKGTYRDYRLTRGAIDRFHEQFNSGQYAEICSEASDEYRGVGSQADEIKVFESVHDKMGNAGKMSIQGFHINATNHDVFVNEVYATRFSKGEGQEGFIWRVDQNIPRLVTYHIDSPNLR
jgi:hypothetical protein